MRRPTSRREGVLITLIVLLAVALRIAHVAQLDPGRTIHSDAAQYYLYATNLVYRGVYSSASPGDEPLPDSFRSPGYPFFLAAVLTFSDGRYFLQTTWVIQALLGALAVLFTYGLAKRVLPAPWSLIAPALVAISPHLIIMSGYLLTEAIQPLLLVLSVFFCVRLCERPTRARALYAGAMLGSSYLTNEVAMLLPLVFGPAMWLACRKKHWVVVMLLVFLLFPAAWAFRTAMIDAPSEGGDRALAAAVQGAYPDFMYETERFRNYPYREDPQYGAMVSSFRVFLATALERASERPLRYLSWYLIEKPYLIWRWKMVQGADDVHVYALENSLFLHSPLAAGFKIALHWLHNLLIIAFAIGIFLVISGRYRSALPPLDPAGQLLLRLGTAAVVYWTLVYTVLLALPRYGLHWRPIFYLLATFGVFAVATRWRERRRGPE